MYLITVPAESVAGNSASIPSISARTERALPRLPPPRREPTVCFDVADVGPGRRTVLLDHFPVKSAKSATGAGWRAGRQNAECKMQNGLASVTTRAAAFLHFAFCILSRESCRV